MAKAGPVRKISKQNVKQTEPDRCKMDRGNDLAVRRVRACDKHTGISDYCKTIVKQLIAKG